MDGGDEIREGLQATTPPAAVQEPGAGALEAGLEAAIAARNERIAELEGEIAEAAEKLRAEMDELRRKGDEERVGFELQIAGARNVKAARALLSDYDNDIDKLRVAEPRLFGAGAPAQTGRRGCRTRVPPPTRARR